MKGTNGSNSHNEMRTIYNDSAVSNSEMGEC
jgi:hypothetical protein